MTELYKMIREGIFNGQVNEMATSKDFTERWVANAILKAFTDSSAIIALFNDDDTE